ncbi:GPO family capsid scaffolding protein [Hafnia alvei]|uniref:GPO family capsid scaffolding protein n=1 Tax=Hafnia alvei TaxID=569 RepID=UPI000B726F2D|nr:GPO family capsid scaffolding protein [Hafnia alvei]MBI0277280.1 GPO family capsid scaffolding protein [Hafnia alvei]PNK97568.1 phage capsid protein [Hafnia alvei]
MPKTKFVRVAVEGATCDGRTLERQHLEQIVKNFNTSVFGARCNLEHIKSLYPESTFRMYGDVLAVKNNEVKDGPLAGKLALFAQLDVTDELVELNRKRQKIYTSIEVNPNFATTGEAYLVGLAFTDSPASLGTEMLQFSATCHTDANPLASRKTTPECFFTAATEINIEYEDIAPASQEEGNSFFTRIKDMLTGSQRQSSDDVSQLKKVIELTAESQGKLLDRVDLLASHGGDKQSVEALSQQVTQLSQTLSDLQTKLATQDASFSGRPAATGSTGDTQLTDC